MVIDSAARFVYVVNEFGNSISAYRIDSSGALVPIPGSPFLAGHDPIQVAVDPTARFLYVANRGSNDVSAYSISSDGTLTPVPGSPFAGPDGPASVVVARIFHSPVRLHDRSRL